MVPDDRNALSTQDVRNPLSLETQEMLHREDAEAWYGVTGVLIFIIAMGLVLALITVTIAY